jgi:flavin reductase (DIM6/NTAB) family NADH-FMN oxidoreductase RutF
VEINPAELSGSERYKLLIGGIVPRPIAVVSTRDLEGRLNLAPFSFFTGVGSEPMTLVFCPANQADGSVKDSLRNADETGEFVVNVAPDRLIERIAAAAEPLPHGESEFDFAGLEPAPSVVVGPPRLAGSPVCFECRTRQVLRLAEGVPGGANLVLGDVVHVHVDDAVIDERLRIDPAAIDLVGRMGGFGYARTRERFTLKAGRAALEEGRRES